MTNGPFNEQILVDKLLKLNSTRQSIEKDTMNKPIKKNASKDLFRLYALSHWCIAHRNKAKQIVEMWLLQFYLALRDQRISFLFLANDILQNSRRKGLEYIEEYWKVLPNVLNTILETGDDVEKHTVDRLINIWEQRKVFGSRESLKQDILTKNIDSINRNKEGISYKLKQPGGEQLQKLVSAFSDVSGFFFDEDTLSENCQAAISFIERFEKDTWSQTIVLCISCSSLVASGFLGLHATSEGNFHSSGTAKELLKFHGLLRDSIKNLKAVESTTTTLVACLREALLEQETKKSRVCQQLKAAQSGYRVSVNLCKQFNIDISPDQRLLESPDHGPPGFSNNYVLDYVEGSHKAGTSTSSTLPQLAASTIYARSFDRSDDIVGRTIEEDLLLNNKRLKLGDEPPAFPSQPQLQRPFPPLHPETLNQPSPQLLPTPVTYPNSSVEPPPPPPSTPFPPPPVPPPLVAPLAPAFTPLADLTTASVYGYAPAPSFANYQMVGFPPHPTAGNQYGFLRASEGFNYGDQPPFPRLPPPPPPPPPLT